MAFADKTGVSMVTGFKLQAEILLDVRGSVEDITERDELVTLKAAPPGLMVFVKSNKTSYVYNGTSWDELSKGSGYTHPSTHPATMITTDSTHRFVTDTQINTWNNKADKTNASASATGLLTSTEWTKFNNAATSAGNLTTIINNTTINGHEIDGTDINITATEVGAIPSTQKGAANGVASLDSTGKVPSAQLPSYVDDVVEGYLSAGKFYAESAHTTIINGESGKIYVDLHTSKTYRWSGTAFAEISASLALGETSSTAYRGDRGKIAYDHSQATHARTDATKTEKSTTNGNVKINGTETVVYTHPSTHPATMITTDSTHRFVTDAQIEAFGASTVYWNESGLPADNPEKAPVGALLFVAVAD